MAELTLRPDLVQRLQQIAEQEHRPVDEVIESLLTRYLPATPRPTEAEQAALLRQDRLRTYERAKQYWRNVGDERQSLTDEQLDEQFWLFDRDGIPRLKSDEGSFQSQPSPLKKMLEIMQSDPTIEWQARGNTSENTKEILNSEYTDYLLARNKRPAEPKHE